MRMFCAKHPSGRSGKTYLVPFSLLATAVLGWSSAHAQTSPPHIAHIFPAGGQRGTTVEVTVRGRHLVGATGIRVSGQGVTGKVVSVEHKEPDPKKKRLDQADVPDTAKIEVTLAADAAPGQRDFRVVSPGGVSNLFRFYVGQVPELNEAEPNDSPEEVQALESIPVLLNGQSFQADRDVFRFKATAGQTLVIDVDGQEILPYIADAVPGWFQPAITLRDAQGGKLAYCDDFRHHPDPLMIYKIEKDGEYLVEIQDALFRGRDDFVYRLSIGALPCITHIFPLGGQRNNQTQVKLYGVNLPTDTTTVDLAGDGPSLRLVQVASNGFTSNARMFAVGDLPEALDTEPNNAPTEAQRIETPQTINGRIDAPGDVDYYYIFSAEEKQQLVIETYARRLDSPMDSILTVFDANGRQLAENDDTKDDSEGLITHHSDSRLDQTFATAGDYVVAVADIQGKGGDEYAYRLTIAPPRPDFILRVQPDNPRASQGGGALLTVNAFRRDGFKGPIKLSAKDLPAGFAISEATISEEQNEARLTLTAPEDAALGILSPTILGTATIGEKEVVREAVPSEELMQAFYYMHNVPSKEFLLAVVEAGPFKLALEIPEGGILKIPARGEANIPVTAKFKEGVAAGAITLKVDAPPKGFRIQAPPIPAGKDQSTVKITTLGQQIRPGQTGTLILTATMKVEKENVPGFVPAIPYKITR